MNNSAKQCARVTSCTYVRALLASQTKNRKGLTQENEVRTASLWPFRQFRAFVVVVSCSVLLLGLCDSERGIHPGSDFSRQVLSIVQKMASGSLLLNSNSLKDLLTGGGDVRKVSFEYKKAQ